MKHKITLLSIVLFTLIFSIVAITSAKEIQQTQCPVMGGQPVENVYTDYQGKRIYFCCAACPDIFKKDPDKYMKKLLDAGEILEDAPKTGS